jgi:hypothetical protein
MRRLALLLLLARAAPAVATGDVGVRLSGCTAADDADVCSAGALLPSPSLSCGGAPVFFAAAPSPDDGSTLALRYAAGEWQLLRACGVQRLCFLDDDSGACDAAAPQCASPPPPPPLPPLPHTPPPPPDGCAAGAPLRSQAAASADVAALSTLAGLSVSLIARGVSPPFACAATSVSAAECAALGAAYAALGGAAWADNAGWRAAAFGLAADACAFAGVRCAANASGTFSVAALLLEGNGLAGTLPQLGALTALTALHLARNALVGSVPASWAASLRALRTVTLASNALSGPLPPPLAALPALTRADLRCSGLCAALASPPLPPSLALDFATSSSSPAEFFPPCGCELRSGRSGDWFCLDRHSAWAAVLLAMGAAFVGSVLYLFWRKATRERGLSAFSALAQHLGCARLAAFLLSRTHTHTAVERFVAKLAAAAAEERAAVAATTPPHGGCETFGDDDISLDAHATSATATATAGAFSTGVLLRRAPPRRVALLRPDDFTRFHAAASASLCAPGMLHPNLLRLLGVAPGRGLGVCDAEGFARPLPAFLTARGLHVTFPVMLRLAADVASGLAYLHTAGGGTVHGSLRAACVLLFDGGAAHGIVARLGCVGASQRHDATSHWPWAAPELLSNADAPPSAHGDEYALGVTLWEIFHRGADPAASFSAPHAAPHAHAISRASSPAVRTSAVLSGARPWLKPQLPSTVKALLAGCWRGAREERLSAAEVACKLERLSLTAELQRRLGYASPAGSISLSAAPPKRDGAESEAPMSEEASMLLGRASLASVRADSVKAGGRDSLLLAPSGAEAPLAECPTEGLSLAGLHAFIAAHAGRCFDPSAAEMAHWRDACAAWERGPVVPPAPDAAAPAAAPPPPPPPHPPGPQPMPALFEALTTAQVVERVIKPLTASAQCSYVAWLGAACDSRGYPLVAPATVFISHAWLNPFSALAAAIFGKLGGDELADAHEVYLWNDIFVSCQHRTEELPQAWWTDAFSHAIRSIGRTLLVLQPWSDPIPLKRAWCLWEIYSTLDEHAGGAADAAASEQQAAGHALTRSAQLRVARASGSLRARPTLRMLPPSLSFTRVVAPLSGPRALGWRGLDIALSPDESASFSNALVGAVDEVVAAMARIDARNAVAFKAEDESLIKGAVAASPGGFEHVNSAVHGVMNEWVLRSGAAALAASRDADAEEGAEESGDGAPSVRTRRLFHSLARLLRAAGEAERARALDADATRELGARERTLRAQRAHAQAHASQRAHAPQRRNARCCCASDAADVEDDAATSSSSSSSPDSTLSATDAELLLVWEHRAQILLARPDGAFRAARLLRRVLARRRASVGTFGPDHAATLSTAASLADALEALAAQSRGVFDVLEQGGLSWLVDTILRPARKRLGRLLYGRSSSAGGAGSCIIDDGTTYTRLDLFSLVFFELLLFPLMPAFAALTCYVWLIKPASWRRESEALLAAAAASRDKAAAMCAAAAADVDADDGAASASPLARASSVPSTPAAAEAEAKSRLQKARRLHAKRRFAAAEEGYASALVALEACLGAAHADTLGACLALSRMLCEQGRRSTLLASYGLHPYAVRLLFDANGRRSRLTRAEALLRRGRASCANALGSAHPTTVEFTHALALCLERQAMQSDRLECTLEALSLASGAADALAAAPGVGAEHPRCVAARAFVTRVENLHVSENLFAALKVVTKWLLLAAAVFLALLAAALYALLRRGRDALHDPQLPIADVPWTRPCGAGVY